VLSRKVTKFSITSVLCTFPDSALCPISRVLRDRHLSKSESVIKVPPHVHDVPTSIYSSLFIGFERMSNDSKVVKVSYKFVLEVF
jgi:hypothetical protein